MRALADELTALCLGEVITREDWERRRVDVLSQTAWMLGLEPGRERTPLNARVTDSLLHDECRVEKVVFESLPGLQVTANFYLPQRLSGAVPCVLYLCGHLHHPLGAKVLYQDRCWWYPQNGFACLAVDPLALGEAAGVHHGTYALNYWHWLSLGYTPAGVEVWNAIRAMDWLGTRSEVRHDRIGVTGISGGGVMTWLVTALDDRVSAAVPTCGTYTIGSQVAQNLVRWQCDCVFYPNIFGLDFSAIGALVAPRPVLVLSGARDPIFPPGGYNEVLSRLRRIYALYGQQERLAAIESEGGHDDTAVTLRESRAWMQRWLGVSGPEAPSGARAVGVRPERLACLDGPPAAAANYSIDQHFISVAARVQCSTSPCAAERRTTLLRQLRETSFRWFPQTPSTAWQVERRPYRDANMAAYGRVEECFLETEPGVHVRLLLVHPRNPAAETTMLAVVRRLGGTENTNDYYDVLPILGRLTVLLVYPRFAELPWTPVAYATVQRTAALVGRTIASMQVWDFLQAVRWAASSGQQRSPQIIVAGRGDDAVTAAYAAILDDRIQHTLLEDVPASHWQGAPLLGVLRVVDLPESLGLLAPRPLTLIRCNREAFHATAMSYRQAGASAALAWGDTLIEVMNRLASGPVLPRPLDPTTYAH